MPSRRWAFSADDRDHVVIAMWSRVSNSGQVTVNGVVQDEWGFTLNIEPRRFRVGEKEAMVRWPNNVPLRGLFSSECVLFLDGVRIPPAKPMTAANRPDGPMGTEH